jgi:hypothetical protein
MQDLNDLLRQWEMERANVSYEGIVDSSGKQFLSTGVFVGITLRLLNAKLFFQQNGTSVESGTVTTANSAGTKLFDSSGLFQTNGIEPGATIINFTDGSIATVLSVRSENELWHVPLEDGSDNQWEVGDVYKIWNAAPRTASGGNLTAVDENGDAIEEPLMASAFVQAVRTTSASATFQESEDIQYASFQGAVWVDAVNGVDSNMGNREYPVKTIQTAVTIAEDRGFDTLQLLSDITLGSGDNVDSYTIIGKSATQTQVTILSAASTIETQFVECDIDGTLDGEAVLRNCRVNDVNYVSGRIMNSWMVGTVTLAPGASAHVLDSHDGTIDDVEPPSIDMGGSGQNLAIRNYYGRISVKNMTGSTDACVVDMSSGTIVLESTVSDGFVYLRGVADVIDNSTGATVYDKTINLINVEDVVWDAELTDSSHSEPTSAGRRLREVGFENGMVWVSAANGDDANTGTATEPVQTISRAKQVCTGLGLKQIHIDGWFTLDTTLAGYEVYCGDTWSDGIDINGFSVSGTSFYDMILQGTPPGSPLTEGYLAFNCYLYTTGSTSIPEVWMYYKECIFGGRSIDSYPVATNISVVLERCSNSGTGYLDTQTGTSFDLSAGTGAEPIDLAFKDWQGRIILRGLTDGNVEISGSGQLNIASTCTGGTIRIVGNWEVVDASGSGCTVEDRSTPLTDAIADSVWDEVLTGATHNVTASAGRRLRELAGNIVTAGTAQSGATSNTIILNGNASTIDGAYDPALIAIVGGTGAGQCRGIYEYIGSTKTAIVDRNWKVIPDDTSEYVVYAWPGREHVNEGLAQGGSSDTITLNALASSIDDAYNYQMVFIRSGTGEDQLRVVKSYDGTTKIATMCEPWDVVPDGTSGYVMLPAHIHPEGVANAVWEEARSAHTDVDTMGGMLNFLMGVEEGEWKITGNQMILYDKDSVEIKRFNLFGSDLVTPDQIDPFRRVPV